MSPLKALAGYLTGRCARAQYWGGVVALFGCNLLLKQAPFRDILAFVLLAAWLVHGVRRLRDIGWSPWLCLAPAAGSLAMFAAAFTVDPNASVPDWALYVTGAVLVGWLGFWVTIGVPRSKPVETSPDRQAEVFG